MTEPEDPEKLLQDAYRVAAPAGVERWRTLPAGAGHARRWLPGRRLTPAGLGAVLLACAAIGVFAVAGAIHHPAPPVATLTPAPHTASMAPAPTPAPSSPAVSQPPSPSAVSTPPATARATAPPPDCAATKGVTGKICGTFTVLPAQSGAGTHPRSLVVSGSDIFYSEEAVHKIGEMTLSGAFVKEWTDPAPNTAVNGMLIGPDGNLWFTEAPGAGEGSKVGRINLTTNAVVQYLFPYNYFPAGIATGPDGNVWVAMLFGDALDAFSPATFPADPTIHTIHSPPNPQKSRDPQPYRLVLGADGAWWFTETAKNKIGRMTMAGVVGPEYNTPGSGPVGLVRASDGNLWFTEEGSSDVVEMSPTGTMSAPIPIPGHANWLWNLVPGADGNVYVAAPFASSIVQVTPSGSVKYFYEPTMGFELGIAIGPDRNIYFADYNTGAIGRLS